MTGPHTTPEMATAAAVTAALIEQRRHMYGPSTCCGCGFVPINLHDWGRHRMAEALDAALAVLTGSGPLGTAEYPRGADLGSAVGSGPSNGAPQRNPNPADTSQKV